MTLLKIQKYKIKYLPFYSFALSCVDDTWMTLCKFGPIFLHMEQSKLQKWIEFVGEPSIFEVTNPPSEVREWRENMKGFKFGSKDLVTEVLVKFFGMIVTKESWNVNFQEKVLNNICESEEDKKRRKLRK